MKLINDKTTIVSTGYYNYNGTLNHEFSAHTTVDATNGDIIIFA